MPNLLGISLDEYCIIENVGDDDINPVHATVEITNLDSSDLDNVNLLQTTVETNLDSCDPDSSEADITKQQGKNLTSGLKFTKNCHFSSRIKQFFMSFQHCLRGGITI